MQPQNNWVQDIANLLTQCSPHEVISAYFRNNPVVFFSSQEKNIEAKGSFS